MKNKPKRSVIIGGRTLLGKKVLSYNNWYFVGAKDLGKMPYKTKQKADLYAEAFLKSDIDSKADWDIEKVIKQNEHLYQRFLKIKKRERGLI